MYQILYNPLSSTYSDCANYPFIWSHCFESVDNNKIVKQLFFIFTKLMSRKCSPCNTVKTVWNTNLVVDMSYSAFKKFNAVEIHHWTQRHCKVSHLPPLRLQVLMQLMAYVKYCSAVSIYMCNQNIADKVSYTSLYRSYSAKLLLQPARAIVYWTISETTVRAKCTVLFSAVIRFHAYESSSRTQTLYKM